MGGWVCGCGGMGVWSQCEGVGERVCFSRDDNFMRGVCESSSPQPACTHNPIHEAFSVQGEDQE